MNETKILIGNSMMIFLIAIAMIYFISEFAMRIKNKTKKHKRQQIICSKDIKMLNPANFISNYDEFITENTKGMNLFEIKEFIKNVNLEIYRIILKGVR